MKNSIKQYNELEEQVIPWKNFEENMHELENYRDEYSKKAGFETSFEYRKPVSEFTALNL